MRYGKRAASGERTVVGLEISLGTVSSGRKRLSVLIQFFSFVEIGKFKTMSNNFKP